MRQTIFHHWRLFALLFIALSISSCTKDDPISPLPLTAPPSMTGSWSGTLTASGVSGPMTINLVQDIIRFTGNGNIGSLSLTVSGENHYPNIKFTFASGGYTPASVTGQFTSVTTISAVVNGSGFVNASLNLTKY